MTQSTTPSRRFNASGIQGQNLILKAISTLIIAAGAGVIMIPFLYMLSTSVKDRGQLRQSPPPLVPMATTTVEINGQAEPLYQVTLNGQIR
jgi:ABC-type glycerol-3-phosphate transport system permease component